MTCGIYRITVRREASGKVPLVYVGSAVNFKRRWSQHRTGHNTNKHLWAARQKYGEANVTEEILEECDRDVALLKERETAWYWYEKANEAAGLCEVANFGPPDESNLIALNADPKFVEARAGRSRETMCRLNADPDFAAARNKRGSDRMRQLHAEPNFRERARVRREDPAFRDANRKATIAANAKYYILAFPCGALLLVYSLRAWAALNGLHPSALLRVAQGHQAEHKGHRCEGPLSEERVKELLEAGVPLWTPPN